MIKYLIVLLAGCGIGYTYGYMQGDAGGANVIQTTLVKTHLRRGAPAGDDEPGRAAADSATRRPR